MNLKKDIFMELSKDRVQWVEYEVFTGYPHVFAGTFLRHGGASSGAYISLNAGDNVGDHPDAVKVNRELIHKQVQVGQIFYAKQVHGTDIIEISSDNLSKKTPEADGLITREKKIGLAITHADCQAAIFYDPQKEIIGVAHAGWKGICQNIYQAMVDYFCQNFGSKPEELIVAISPSLCPQHFEFKEYKENLPREYWDYQKEKNHFDLRSIAQKQLLDAKIKAQNMEITDTCTYEGTKDYFSYRRDKITGRHATIVALKE